MTEDRRQTGSRGEDAAARFLEKEGFRVLGRNYRFAGGELDLIVEGPPGLVFVEVRTKRQPALVLPEETITRAKLLRVIRTAQRYLAETGREERPWRVDVVAVAMDADGKTVSINHFPDATSHLVY